MKRDQVYYDVLLRTNKSQAGMYLDQWNTRLKSLPSSTNQWKGEPIETSAPVVEPVIKAPVEPVVEPEAIEPVEPTKEPEVEPVIEDKSDELDPSLTIDGATKEEKIQFLKDNGMHLASNKWSDETIAKKIEEVKSKAE